MSGKKYEAVRAAMIARFVKDLNAAYPNLTLEIVKSDYDDSIMIHHNSKELDLDESFLDLRLALEDKYFFENDIYNVGFSYSYLFSKKVETLKQEQLQVIEDASKKISLCVRNTHINRIFKAFAPSMPADSAEFNSSPLNLIAA
jgi:hypothetical protein